MGKLGRRAAEQQSKLSIDRLCVIGHPSRLGGADTELDHQIHCWQAMGVEVHICHTGDLDDNLRAMKLVERGCIYHEPRDWASLQGLHCISFCNGEYLKSLPEIRRFAKSTSWVNCMTWNFDEEIEMHAKGLIDFHLYQTAHAYARVSPALHDLGGYTPLMFTPYFHSADFPFRHARPRDRFRFGRISRCDPGKFGARQLWIYETMTAPVLKEGLILGWDHRIEEKLGKPASYVKTLPAGDISQREFYDFCDAVILTTETFENLPRVGFEAMASGSILIVDNRGGWQKLVEDGVTGWLCDDDREFVYKASRCAFEISEREAMARCAADRLRENWGLETSIESWGKVFEEWATL
ncbi:MAG: glycosyltransferase [Planctomycetaceae bacterium]|nr:glycosyltransferase [Planctomycetaceae bacterium]